MRVNGMQISNMVKEQINSLMVILSGVNIKLENLMDLVFIHGQMDVFMKETLNVDLNMEKGNGKKLRNNLVLQLMNIVVNT